MPGRKTKDQGQGEASGDSKGSGRPHPDEIPYSAHAAAKKIKARKQRRQSQMDEIFGGSSKGKKGSKKKGK